MTRDYTHYLVNLVNEDPDYIVDVLGLSSWELIKAFPVKAERFIKEEYGVGPEDEGSFSDSEEEDGYGDDEEESWANGGEEDDD